MRNLLGDRWDGPFKLTHVELLSAGLERLGESPFDIILLDLSLPDSQGLETFFTMHAHAGDVPIVVLSGYNDESIAVQGRAGRRPGLPGQGPGRRQPARPLDPLRHRAHAAAQGRSGPARRLGGVPRGQGDPAAAVSLRSRRSCPASTLPAQLYPAKATAGDYFDYIPMLGNCLGVVVGDVSSHGMGPALLMSETRACLRTLGARR